MAPPWKMDSTSSSTTPHRVGGKANGSNNVSSVASTSNGTKQQQRISKELESSSRNIRCGRYLFVIVLLVAAAVLGYGAFSLMDKAQTEMASERFESVSERAVSLAQYVIEEKKRASDSLALMIGSAHPNASAWPMVSLDGYADIASSLRSITQGSLSFCPIVKPGGEEQRQFEEFAYDLFEKEGYPPETGESAFGRGIFSYGTGEFGNETYPDGRFHITSGWTYHYSSREILVPFIQSDIGAHSALMLNVHFEHRRAAVIDSVMTCSEERARAGDNRDCGSITEMMWSATEAKDVEDGPAGLMMIPIYPRLDNTTLTGFIVVKQLWGDLLRYTFEPSVSGIDVVFHSEENAHAWRITAGEAEYVGPGWDHHDKDAQFQVRNVEIKSQFFSNADVSFYVDLYATDEFVLSAGSFGQSESNLPVTACIAAVAIMIFTSLLFVLYDYWVRKEFNSKKKLLDAKRQFVRFVSHEVRTPLNTICMGLTLLQNDLKALVGADKSERGSMSSLTSEKSSSTVSTTLSVGKSQVDEWIKVSGEVATNAESAVNVLSDLLNYDKIQTGSLALELSPINLWKFLEQQMGEFKIAAKEKSMKLRLDLSPLLEFDLDRSFHDTLFFGKGAAGSSMSLEAPENVTTAMDLPSDIGFMKVIADDVRLAQVYRNLLSNALKFSRKGGNLTVRVAMKPLPRRRRKEETMEFQNNDVVRVMKVAQVNVSVIDDGVGMTAEQVRRVFDDGTQFNANELQNGGGSGLGLNIARGIVVQHGGELTCSSQGLGKGTTFTVTMPIYEELFSITNDNVENNNVNIGDPSTIGGDADVKGSQPSNEACPDFVIPKLHILVVDDALTNRKLCMRLLERAGHSTEGACDGSEAVEMVRSSLETGKLYDCILLDYEMPIMRGPRACQLMRKMGCSSYIAGVTGNVMSEDVDHFRKCGADWVLPKPFRLESLEQQWIEQGVVPRSTTGSEETAESTLMVELPDEGRTSSSSTD
ncbi:MAG: hypothetical protein SGILL_006166 [Bacillariaceae sp.]